jgi:hypothetical protein
MPMCSNPKCRAHTSGRFRDREGKVWCESCWEPEGMDENMIQIGNVIAIIPSSESPVRCRGCGHVYNANRMLFIQGEFYELQCLPERYQEFEVVRQ